MALFDRQLSDICSTVPIILITQKKHILIRTDSVAGSKDWERCDES